MSKGHAISADPQNNPELHRDILADLKSWLAQLVADKGHRAGEMAEIEIGYVKRAIEEMNSFELSLQKRIPGRRTIIIRRDDVGIPRRRPNL